VKYGKKLSGKRMKNRKHRKLSNTKIEKSQLYHLHFCTWRTNHTQSKIVPPHLCGKFKPAKLAIFLALILIITIFGAMNANANTPQGTLASESTRLSLSSTTQPFQTLSPSQENRNQGTNLSIEYLAPSPLIVTQLPNLFSNNLSSQLPTNTTNEKPIANYNYYAIFTIEGVIFAQNRVGAIVYNSTDAAAVINYALGKGNVHIYLRIGVYSCQTSIIGKSGVFFEGEARGDFENFTSGTVLKYCGGQTQAFIDARECRDFNIANLKIKNTGGAVIGIYIGSAQNDANKTKAIHFSELVIDGFGYGLRGYTFGPDDSTYEDCFIGNNVICNVDNLSSESKFYGGTLYTSAIGVRVQRAAGASADAGMAFWGTTFSGNAVCVEIAGEQSINHLTFTACWFENTDKMILRTTNAKSGIDLGSVEFINCIGTVNSQTFMDLSCRNIWMSWGGGTLYPTNGVIASIITDGTGGTLQHVHVVLDAGQELIYFNDTANGLAGFNSAILLLINDANGYSPASALTTNWLNEWQSFDFPSDGHSLVKVSVTYKWDPNGANSGIALNSAAGRFGTVEASGNTQRSNTIDITAYARTNMNLRSSFDLQLHGDGTKAPSVHLVEIIYEW
jgi:hypothetical protein